MSSDKVLDKFVQLSDDTFSQLKKAHYGFIKNASKELQEAAGFAMIVSTKGALGISVEKGDGFVVANLGKSDDGKAKFSAPLFIHSTKVGLGVSLGYTHVYTLLVFSSKAQVNAFTEKDVVFGRDLAINEEPQVYNYNEEVPDATVALKTSTTVDAANVLAVADGILVDVSINGGSVAPNEEINNLVYEGKKTPKDILFGDVAVPEHFAKVYEKILSGHVA